MKKPNNEIEYFNSCYKCGNPSELSLCINCIKSYNKTWYYKISNWKIDKRDHKWRKDIISARPIRLFGIYLFSLLKIANPNYEWACSESYDKGNCRCKKHLRCHCSDTEIPHLHQDGKIYK